MKLYVILVIILFILCGNKEVAKAQEQSFKYNYKKEIPKKTYFADFNFRGDFEIIFNGMSIKRNRSIGVSNSLEYLNPFIERSGKQSITLVMKPLSGKVMPHEAQDFYIDIVYTDNGEAAPVHKIMRCSFPPTGKSVESLAFTWTFDTEVPFEITTLTDAQDLNDEKPENLLKEVIEVYENVYDFINNGNSVEYLNLYKKSHKREMLSMYYDDVKQKEYLSNIHQRVASSKGYMQTLSDYRLLLHPNQKVVSLINSQGKSPLYSKDSEGKIKTYGLQLYRSKTTGKLEVY